jgi:histidinol phosphatase-like enzyme
MIRAIITDGDGVLNFPGTDADVVSLLGYLNQHGIQHIVVTNKSEASVLRKFNQAGYQLPNHIISPACFNPRKRKPSPEFINEVMQRTGFQNHELIYIGDDTRTDILCAINAGILPLGATYSSANTANNLQYCLELSSISDIQVFLEMFSRMDSPYFGWECLSGAIDVRCALSEHRAIRYELEDLLKRGNDRQLPSGVNVSQLVIATLLSQIYFSGLANDADYITLYPGHTLGSLNPFLNQFLQNYSRILKIRFEQLIIRHVNARSSRRTNDRTLENQINSIHLDPTKQKYIQGNHIIVLDDFTTSGTSLEAAKLLLQQGGARRVTLMAFGKFRPSHVVYTLINPIDPYQPVTITDSDYLMSEHYSTNDTDLYFRNHIRPYF